jgi:hypothetical protein
MIKVEIKDETFYVPTSWDEVTLGKLLKLNELKDKKYTSSIDQTAEVIEIMSGITTEVSLELSLEDFKTLSSLLEWCSEMPVKDENVKEIFIEGAKYVPVDVSVMSAGEFISLEVFQNEKEADKNIHLLASILIRPEVDGSIEKLKDMKDIQERAELFSNKMTVGQYWPVFNNFFVGAVSSSLKSTQASSSQQKNKLKIVNS